MKLLAIRQNLMLAATGFQMSLSQMNIRRAQVLLHTLHSIRRRGLCGFAGFSKHASDFGAGMVGRKAWA